MISARGEFVMLDLLKYGVVITMAVGILNAAAYAEDKTTVMLGSHYWDIDNQCFGKSDTADFLWIFGTDNNGFFKTTNRAKMAMIVGRSFDKIDCSIAKAQNLIEQRIFQNADHGGRIKPGAVIVFETAEGKFGKLEILGFRSSHDFSFREAASLTKEWKKFVLKKPETGHYHLEVKWRLFDH